MLALKKNQKGLYEEAQDWMGKHKAQMDVYSEVGYCGGRVERRMTYVCDDLTYIDESPEMGGQQKGHPGGSRKGI
ncbi:MAG: hypothetical protein R2825_23515 [Saprospiraceae bacterium]